MPSPRERLRLKRLALPASALLHLLALTGLALGFRDLALPPPQPPIQVMLVPALRRQPPPPEPPARQIRLHRPKAVRPSETPPLVAPTVEAEPPASAPDLEALRIAPFADPDRAGKALRARARCNGSSLPKSAAEWNDCPPAPMRPKPDETHLSGISRAKESEFDRAVETKKAWKTYRETTTAPYPGLRCTLGRSC